MTPFQVQKMTRRDRAAVALALECLRRPTDLDDAVWLVREAADVLRAGGARTAAIADRLFWNPRYRTADLLRARLALLLRALLRMDAGDDGRHTYGWFCSQCGAKSALPDRCPWEGMGPGSCKCDKGCPCPAPHRWVDHRRIRPLWEQVPERSEAQPGAGEGE